MITLISLGTGPLAVVTFLGVGLIFFIPFFYLLCSAIAKRFLSVDWYVLAVYMSASFFVASFAEPIGDMLYKAFFGEYLWTYQFLPIMGGASTAIGLFSWPFYGYYCYFLHQVFRTKGWNMPTWKEGVVSAIDGIPFDMLANVFSLIVFGFIFFYYPSPELWHLSALWAIPIYLAYGILFAYLLRYLLKQKITFLIPIGFYVAGCAIMFLGDYVFKLLN